MSKWVRLELQEFLATNPKMRLTHFDDASSVIEGEYNVDAQMDGFNPIHQSYDLKIVFPEGYPKEIPTVTETKQTIPRNPDYHTYDDGSFCLGSGLKLKEILSETPNVSDFIGKILDPFLYSISYKLKYHEFPNGDLAHGEEGLIDDYERLFNVKGKRSVLRVLEALGKRKRVANKLRCACGCGKKLGACDFRVSLIKWRKLDKRRWFRDHLSQSFSPIEIPKRKKRRKMVSIKPVKNSS